jgi:hypothetical protein
MNCRLFVVDKKRVKDRPVQSRGWTIFRLLLVHYLRGAKNYLRLDIDAA